MLWLLVVGEQICKNILDTTTVFRCRIKFPSVQRKAASYFADPVTIVFTRIKR
jgi:hypothetical protein